jgi:hypothetical protein
VARGTSALARGETVRAKGETMLATLPTHTANISDKMGIRILNLATIGRMMANGWAILANHELKEAK